MSIFNKYPYLDFNNLNLDWVISIVKALDANVDALNAWREEHEAEYQELNDIMQRINNGELTPALRESIYTWLQTNAIDIIGELATSVFFEISDSGYWIAYVPESWEDITFFTTGLDITLPIQPDYGHLVLAY